MNDRLKCDFRGLILLAGVIGSCASVALAQYAGPAISTSSASASAPAFAMKADYADVEILPGDIISIETYGVPELTTTAPASPSGITSPNNPTLTGLKVGSSGDIMLPYLGTVKIAGLTPSQASAYLSNALKAGGFLVDPQVTVQLVDSPTRVITVIGEVQRPSPVPAFGHIRLLDAISACGGLTTMASHTVTIRRFGLTDPITVELGVDPKTSGAVDIPLTAGDTIIVPKVGDVFVVGQVKTPSAIPLSFNSPITVVRAISLAGGANFGAALSKVKIIRTTAENQKVEIQVDLMKILNGKQEDVALASDDVLFVPSNAFKASLAAGAASVAATALYGAAYTISVSK